MPNRIFVTAIDTNIGKTCASAILCKALGADYWKPLQCGDLDNSDSIKVKRWTNTIIHPEAYSLKYPQSPHAAAAKEGVEIFLDDIHVPPTENHLIIEGAGGVLVPLNHRATIADLIQHCQSPVIVVSRNYLGSINHTLLTLNELKHRNSKVLGIVMIGAENQASEEAIVQLSGVPIIAHIKWSNTIDKAFVTDEATRLKPALQQLLIT